MSRAETAVDYPPVSDNAALQYWQAFAMLPALDAEQEKLLENCTTAPLDAAATKLLDQSHASLMFLTRGAKLRQCDWGLDYHDGISLLLPHLAKARTLARIATLEGRRAFAAGQSDRARDMAFGMMTLARQVGRDHTLVSVLVCYALEGLTIDLVAPHIPDLKASYADAVKQFESLPPSPQLDQAVECEKRLADSIIRQLKEAEQRRPGGWRDVWRNMLSPDSPDSLKNLDSLEQIIKLSEGFQATYDELAQLVALPPAEFDAQFPGFVERARGASPWADLMLPAMNKVVAAQRRAQVRMAMLLASIAFVEGGEQKLAEIKDPFGDGPFAYRKLETGFELSSKLTEDGKPVTLKIGQKTAAAK
jgi:hypothetical protein